LKVFFKTRTQIGSGNRQELGVGAIGCPQNAFFLRTCDLLVSRKIMQKHYFPALYHLYLRHFATSCAKVYEGHLVVQTSLAELPNSYFLT